MKKRLNKSEINAVAQMIYEKANRVMNENVRALVQKDAEWKKLEKLKSEIDALQKEISKKNNDSYELQRKINEKLKEKVGQNVNINVFANFAGVHVNVNNNYNRYSDIQNELILLNIKDTDIEGVINSLIEKHSKI